MTDPRQTVPSTRASSSKGSQLNCHHATGAAPWWAAKTPIAIRSRGVLLFSLADGH